MGVFDGKIKIPLRVADPLTDKKLGNSGLLPWGSITSLTGLAGTTGTDCKLVHGDRWQEIQGNMTEHYTNNVNTTIDQDWTIQVNGIMNLTVVQGYNEVEQGPVNRTYWLVVNDTFQSDHNVSVPDSTSFAVTKYTNTLVTVEQIGIVVGMQMSIIGVLGITLVAAIDLEFKVLHAEFHPFHGDGKIVKLYAYGEDAGATANETPVKTQTAVRASVNAGVDVDCGFPPT